jgi:SWI/SNF-related matrix-associated actin-dependent regulator 1 of chromatin subfamily A
LKFVWQSPKDIDPTTRKALDALEQVPGVKLEGMTLEVPHTYWGHSFNLPAWIEMQDTFSQIRERGGIPWNHARGDLWPRGRDPFPWQWEAIELAQRTASMLLADEMGLGKTLAASVAAEFFARKEAPDRPRYIFAPLFTLSTWRRELLLSGVISDESELCVLSTRDHHNHTFDPAAPWYFCHYDVLPYWASRLAMHKRGKPAAVIYDEIHRLKNPTAQRTKAAMLVGSGSLFRMGLSGTPMDQGRDLFSALSLVTGPFTWGSFSAYRERYCGAYNAGHGLVDGGPTNIEELRERMSPFYLRRTIESSGAKLPPLIRRQVSAFLTPAQRKKHDEALGKVSMHELVQAVLEGRAGKKTLEILMKVRKVTGQAKTATTVDFVSSLLEQGESVVVFCWQPEKAEDLASSFLLTAIDSMASSTSGSRMGLAYVVHGGVSQANRDITIEQWQQTGGALIATYGVLREGVTLTRARHVVLHDLDWTPSVVLQAEARVYRIGQTKPTFSHWVTAEDSIDTLLARVLYAKAEQASKTLDLGEALAAVDELQLKRLVEDDFDPVAWAQDQLSRWRGDL